MKPLKQIRVVFIGEPDAGKSTLIKHFVEVIAKKEISPDTLMHEVHYSDGTDPDGNPDTRTMRCAKILVTVGCTEWCLYDAPGHLEYRDQIYQGVSAAHVVVHVHRDNGGTHEEYIDKLCQVEPEVRHLVRRKPLLNVWSHSRNKDYYYYDTDDKNRFQSFCYQLIGFVD